MPIKPKGKKRDDGGIENELFIRFYDTFSRTMENLRKCLSEIDKKREAQDASVNYGMGIVESRVVTQGIDQGATRTGMYGVSDLLFNPNLQQYLIITKEGVINRYDWAGSILPSPKPPKLPLTNFIYCAPTSHYICWVTNKSSFFLARDDFTVVVDSIAVAPIGKIIFSGRKSEESFDFFIISGSLLSRYSYHPSTNLISLQDAMTLSDIESDGKVIEETCFDNPSDDRKQWIYCTFGSNCTIMDVTGRVLGTRRNLHTNLITAIAAIEPDFIITGDSKGLLKVWGSRLGFIAEVQAHSNKVTHIIQHPDGHAAISFGKDHKLFVWEIHTQKELQSLPLPEVVERVAVNKKQKAFMTQGPRKLVNWRMNFLYELRQHVSAPLKRLYFTPDNGQIERAVALCEDNSLHVMNPATGVILTTALVNPTEPLIRSVCYRRTAEVDVLYALVEDEMMLDLQQFDCRMNPSPLKETWEEGRWSVGITCMAVYEYNPKVTLSEVEMAFNKRTKAKNTLTTFLLCGRRDGCVAVVSFDTGKMEYFAPCHKSPVMHIEIDYELNQALSLGSTPSLRLWKINLNRDDMLIPLLDISWKYPIRLATFIRNVIAFTLDHKDTNQHNILMYNTSSTQRYEHEAGNGHTMDILSLSACRDLFIFCTSSLDGTVVIRGAKNELYRRVLLNMIPSYAGFITRQGDILFGVEKKIYVILAQKHLTLVPRTRALLSGVPPNKIEAPLPVSLFKAGRDPRNRSPEELMALPPFPSLTPFVESADSQQAHQIELLRLRDIDLWKIIEGKHPLEELVPDFHNMTKQEWDAFGKSVYDDDKKRKFFVSESRIAAMLKMKGAEKDLNNFDNII